MSLPKDTELSGLDLGFLGGGQMAEALIKGILSKGVLGPGQIHCSDPSETRRHHLEETYGVSCLEDNKALPSRCDVLLLAVKPQVMTAVLEDIQGRVTGDHLVVSIAAGIRLSTLEGALPTGTRIIRVMPNTPALVLHGASAVCPGAHASLEDLDVALSLFKAVGTAVVVREERLMDAVTGLSGSGPAYVFSFVQGLVDAGIREGLPRDLAAELAVNTVLGAAVMCRETGGDPARLTAMVTSPGGTTIEGLYALEKGGFKGLVMDAVHRATLRSMELGGDDTKG